jgi:hypothetical protein
MLKNAEISEMCRQKYTSRLFQLGHKEIRTYVAWLFAPNGTEIANAMQSLQ